MLANYENELICDFMQYYHLDDWSDLPVEKAAVLACGLPADSRLIKAVNKQKISVDTMLLAVIADRTTQLVWFQTKDGHKHRNKPKSFVKMLTQTKEPKKSERSFSSGAEFEEARKRIIEGK